jgi:trehalose 6-phosphate synthase
LASVPGREARGRLAGRDLVGFHTQSHCNNFLETVDHNIEALTSGTLRDEPLGHVTGSAVSISVAFPEGPMSLEEAQKFGANTRRCAKSWVSTPHAPGRRRPRELHEEGILELRAISVYRRVPSFRERRARADWRTRWTQIDRSATVRWGGCGAARINARFATGRWRPIALLNRHHSHEQIAQFFRAAFATW